MDGGGGAIGGPRKNHQGADHRRARARLVIQHLRLQGFGIDHHEAQELLEEAENILVTAWPGEGFSHHGKFWHLDVPMLRPRPYTQPHPVLIRAASGEASMLELARQGRPFLMNVQSMAVTSRRVDLYRAAMREAGYGEERIARTLAGCWVWRNVVVAATDAQAQRAGGPMFP